MQDTGSFEGIQEGSLCGPIVNHPDGTDSDDERQKTFNDELARWLLIVSGDALRLRVDCDETLTIQDHPAFPPTPFICESPS